MFCMPWLMAVLCCLAVLQTSGQALSNLCDGNNGCPPQSSVSRREYWERLLPRVRVLQQNGCGFSNDDLVDFMRAAGFTRVSSDTDTLVSRKEVTWFTFFNPARPRNLDRGFAYLTGKNVQTLALKACYKVLLLPPALVVPCPCADACAYRLCLPPPSCQCLWFCPTLHSRGGGGGGRARSLYVTPPPPGFER